MPTPPYQFHTLLANAGQMDSYGAELSLSYVALKKEDFSWKASAKKYLALYKNMLGLSGRAARRKKDGIEPRTEE